MDTAWLNQILLPEGLGHCCLLNRESASLEWGKAFLLLQAVVFGRGGGEYQTNATMWLGHTLAVQISLSSTPAPLRKVPWAKKEAHLQLTHLPLKKAI